MGLNFNALKLEFFKYIEEKEQGSSKSGVTNPIDADTSIFAYANEWNDFLKENKSKLDLPDNFSGSISDLMKLYDEESGSFTTEKTDGGDKNFFSSFINDLLKNDDVKKAADTDSNNSISQEEMTAFLEALDAIDKEEGQFSLEDMFEGFNAIQNGAFSLNAEEEEPAVEETAETPAPASPSGGDGAAQTPAAQTPTAQTPVNSADNPKEETQTGAKDITKMSLNELNSEKTTTINDRNQAIDLLNQIQKGEGPVAELKEAADKAYEAFQKELEKKDSQLAKEYDAAKKDADTKQNAVDENDTAITKKTTEKNDAQADLDNAKANVESIKSCISNLEAALSSAKDEDKSAIESQLQSAKAELEAAEKKVEESQANLDKITADLQILEGATEGLKKDLKEAQDKLNEIETKVNELVSKEGNEELKGLKDTYDAAQKKYTEGKETATEAAKKAIKEKQEYIDKINQQIPETQKTENEKKYSADKTEKTIEDKVSQLGGNSDGLTIQDDGKGGYNVTEKTQDGNEVYYKFDKDGNMLSYTDALGTFTANGNSVTVSSKYMQKWAKDNPTYNINASLEDIVGQMRKSSPKAESFINTALSSFGESGLAGKGDNCVLYANYVFTKMGEPIGAYSDDVKTRQQISLSDAQTGDIYNNGQRHIGMVLMHVKDRNGNDVLLTADASASGVAINIRDGKDESLPSAARIYKGIST